MVPEFHPAGRVNAASKFSKKVEGGGINSLTLSMWFLRIVKSFPPVGLKRNATT
jgi:hypothetical protein